MQNAAVGNLQGDWPGRQRLRKMKRSPLQARIERYFRGQGLAVDLCRDCLKLQIPRVQHDRIPLPAPESDQSSLRR